MEGWNTRLNMAYLYDFPNISAQPDDILVGIGSEVSVFIPMLLLFVWCVIFIGGISRQKAKTGTSDAPAWAVASSLSILMMTALMGIKRGLVSLEWTVVVVVITIFSGVWLFLDTKD